MPSEIKASTTDELRTKNYRAQMQQTADLETRELEAKHNQDIERLNSNFKDQYQDLKHAYDIAISQEAEALEEKLHQVRDSTDEKVSSEKKLQEDELTKIKTVNQQRIDEYKKNADAQLDQIRKQYQASSEDLHTKAKKDMKKEKELTKV